MNLYVQWFVEQPYLRIISGILFWFFASKLFFRWTQGVGKILFALVSAILAALFYFSPVIQIFASLILITALFFNLFSGRKSRQEYQPAVARVEGGGIKRGLLPAEAAIILGVPFNLIIILVLFGMLKKGLLQQISVSPWKLEIDDRFRTSSVSLDHKRRTEFRRETALNANIVLLKYEQLFLELIEHAQGKETTAIDFRIIIKPIVKYVVNRIAGYDLEETREYYELIIQRAHLEARGSGELVSDRDAIFDRNLEWILLNENLEVNFVNEDFSYLPIWMRDRERQENQLDGGEMFGPWVSKIIEQMKDAVPAEALNINLDGESENVLASLLSEISRATFYG